MTRILSLAGALLIATAAVSAAHAGPASDAWLSKSRADLEAKVSQAGLADNGKVVKIRVRLNARGVDQVLIAQSSGSTDFDNAVKAQAAKGLTAPPSELAGRSVVFTIGGAAGTATGAN